MGVLRKTTVILLGALLLPAGAGAATWTVEKEGSGDFTIIQDALDAAAAGDSILIGPGRFDTFRPGASTVDSFQFAAIAWVTTPSLTIIGAGKDLTIVGPKMYTHEALGLPAGGVYLDGESAGSRLSGVAVENLNGPITIRDQATLDDCRGTKSDPGATFTVAVLDGFDSLIYGCEFFGAEAIATGSGAGRLTIDACRIVNTSDFGNGIVIGNGAKDCVVRECIIDGGAVGIAFGFGGSAEIEDTEILGQEFANLDVTDGLAVVRNCDLGTARISLRIGIGRLEVYDTIIGGGSFYTIASTGDVYVRNSHILNGGAQTVLGSSSGPGEFNDLRENWWGTADEAQIEAWITDEDGTVLWQPILEAPVTATETSFGQIKTRYGRQ